nr:MAG TPA: hypothetical protein [Caudoviricetes sp.]DAX27360.1 MAG TPA: hypothetical protein [Caudoviricetes sp.]DAX94477.1 MAG TPA: hypothetical protein [Caudoviricetes sp.]
MNLEVLFSFFQIPLLLGFSLYKVSLVFLFYLNHCVQEIAAEVFTSYLQ